MRVLAIDPGKLSGYCLMGDQGVLACNVLPHAEVIQLVSRDREADVLAVESQYGGFNVKTLIGLIELRCQIEAAWQMSHDGDGYRIHPRTWQAHELRRDARGRAAIKRESMHVAQSMWSERVYSDEADAILIAHYALTSLRLGIEPGSIMPRFLTPPPCGLAHRPSAAISARPRSTRATSLTESTHESAGGRGARK